MDCVKISKHIDYRIIPASRLLLCITFLCLNAAFNWMRYFVTPVVNESVSTEVSKGRVDGTEEPQLRGYR